MNQFGPITRKMVRIHMDVLSIYYIALIQGIDNISVQKKMASQTKTVYENCVRWCRVLSKTLLSTKILRESKHT